jgi:predicted 3-demethylubiquinone-9 3-methyltransferase (glyoxalase superfamily)
MTVEWELDGQRFIGINGGPQYKFSEAVSFQINCADQDEVDYYWEKLTDGGEEGPSPRSTSPRCGAPRTARKSGPRTAS